MSDYHYGPREMHEKKEVDRVINLFCSAPYMHTTLNSRMTTQLLERTSGQMFARGELYCIVPKLLGPDVYQIKLEKWA